VATSVSIPLISAAKLRGIMSRLGAVSRFFEIRRARRADTLSAHDRLMAAVGGLGSLMSSTAVVAAGLYETSGVDASLEELKSINHNLVSLQQPSKTCSGNEQSGKQTARRRC
jgi:hypothetical protein